MIKSRPQSKFPKKTVVYQEVDTHLQGRRLLLARVVWSVLVVLILGMFFAFLPEYIAQLRTICSGASCNDGQLTSATIHTLQHFGISLENYIAYEVVFTLMLAGVSFVVGGVLAWRKSNDRMALLVALIIILFGTSNVSDVVGGYAGSPLWALLANLLNLLAFTGYFLMLALFPDGRFVPRWTWLLPVGWFTLGITLILLNKEVPPQTPISIAVAGFVWLGFSGSALFAQVYRYARVSGPIQRQQTKWLVYSSVVAVLLTFLTSLPSLLFPDVTQPGSPFALIGQALSTSVILLLPLSVGIAILRYRLYDIDVLINRTLVYGSLTILLVFIYLASVLGLEALLHNFTQSSDLAIVGSTLAIAALFQPLRRSIQKLIDRRFYRSKYNAAQTLANFSTTLRNEVNLTQLSEHLVGVVNETMQPTHVSLWLRKPIRKGERS